MRKIVFYTPGPYCNTGTYELVEYAEGTSDQHIDQDHFEWACEQYAMYGVEYDPEAEFDDEDCTAEIDGSWSDYDPAKHDGYL